MLVKEFSPRSFNTSYSWFSFTSLFLEGGWYWKHLIINTIETYLYALTNDFELFSNAAVITLVFIIIIFKFIYFFIEG